MKTACRLGCLVVTVLATILGFVAPPAADAATQESAVPGALYTYDGVPQRSMDAHGAPTSMAPVSLSSPNRSAVHGALALPEAASRFAAEDSTTVVNLGGEGEVPGAINQQPANALEPGWGASRGDVAGKSLAELRAMGDPYVVADNTALPFADQSVDQVLTNSVPIDIDTPMGPGVQSSEIWRILKPGGQWLHNGSVVPPP